LSNHLQLLFGENLSIFFGVIKSYAGQKIIKEFLDSLPKNIRDIVEKRVKENYRYQTWNAKEFNKYKNRVKSHKKNEKGEYEVELKKEWYYEEYITAYGQALKEKQIKPNESVKKKISNLFYPLLQPLFPRLYEIEGITSIKAGKDLHKMLENVYATSELMLKRELGLTNKKENK